MKQASRRGSWRAVLVVLGMAAACGKTGSSEDSQTHWLDECTRAADCGSGLDCECGRCVVTCTSGTACSVPGSETARCFEAGSTVVQSLCDGADAPALCLAECVAGSCPPGQQCSDGACLPIGSGDGGGGAGGAGGEGGGTSTCYGPRQNLDRADQPGATGCPCNPGSDPDVCALSPSGGWLSLTCSANRWSAVEDGVCGGLEPGRDCSSDQACPSGESCAISSVSGRRCAPLPEQVTTCPGDHPANECCMSAECSAGACYESIFYPTGPCGGGGGDAINRCLMDECATDAQCAANEVCVSGAKLEALKACVPVSCRTSADCGAAPGGSCIWIAGGCCGGVGSGFDVRAPTLACVYPSDWCRSDADCAAPTPFCVVDGTRAHCAAECR